MEAGIKLFWEPFEGQFGDTIRNLRDHVALVEKQSKVAEMLESAREREKAEQERKESKAGRTTASNSRAKSEKFISGIEVLINRVTNRR